MNELAKVIVRSGVLETSQLDELRKWKSPAVMESSDPGPDIQSAEELARDIEQALQSKELVVMRATDLDVVPQFLRTQKQGLLHVTSGTEEAEFPYAFGRTPMGDYILPFTTDLVEEILTNNEGYLIDEGQAVHFSNVVVSYFGETKTFLICTPSKA